MAVGGAADWLRRLAGRDVLPVFVARGRDSTAAVRRFFAQGGARRVASPRHAQVLLVAGRIPEHLLEALHRIHDQMPHPRLSVWWGSTPPERIRSTALTVSDGGSLPLPADLAARLFAADYVSELDIQADKPPAPWRGRGDHGQGGEGMMGGVPYGRPMAMTGDELRDGLQLDRPRITIGPFFPPLPAGLSLELELQGDVIQNVRRCHPPFPPDRLFFEPFLEACTEAVPLARLERLRAASHLHHLANYLRLCDLHGLARRFDNVAEQLFCGQKVGSLVSLRNLLLRSGALGATARGFGRLDSGLLTRLDGPARRAAGEGDDRRAGQAAYQELNFLPRYGAGGDVRARISQWLREAEAACALAERCDRTMPVPALTDSAVESATGSISASLSFPPADDYLEPSAEFSGLMQGMEWHEAMLFLASFDAMALRQLLANATDNSLSERQSR